MRPFPGTVILAAKFSQHGKGNSQSGLRDTKSPIQDKLKEKHAKTHANQTNKD